jgi:hypothetical protein
MFSFLNAYTVRQLAEVLIKKSKYERDKGVEEFKTGMKIQSISLSNLKGFLLVKL